MFVLPNVESPTLLAPGDALLPSVLIQVFPDERASGRIGISTAQVQDSCAFFGEATRTRNHTADGAEIRSNAGEVANVDLAVATRADCRSDAHPSKHTGCGNQGEGGRSSDRANGHPQGC